MLTDQIEQQFPFLPAGCHMSLDRVASELILENIKRAVPAQWPQRVTELREMMAEGLEPSLAHYLEHTGLELEDIYASNRSWSDLFEAAGCDVLPHGPNEKTLRRAVGRLLHVNDAERQRAYRAFLGQETAPLFNTLSVGDARLLRMVVAMLLDSIADKNTSMKAGLVLLWQHPQVRHEVCLLMNMLEHQIDHVNQPLSERPDVPIATHARYSRIEILAAFGVGGAAKGIAWREGVRWVSEAEADVFVFTLDKSSGSFSPTTRYRTTPSAPSSSIGKVRQLRLQRA